MNKLKAFAPMWLPVLSLRSATARAAPRRRKFVRISPQTDRSMAPRAFDVPFRQHREISPEFLDTCQKAPETGRESTLRKRKTQVSTERNFWPPLTKYALPILSRSDFPNRLPRSSAVRPPRFIVAFQLATWAFYQRPARVTWNFHGILRTRDHLVIISVLVIFDYSRSIVDCPIIRLSAVFWGNKFRFWLILLRCAHFT